MATRSATIKKAQQNILQGSNDPEWSDEDWNDYYHEAMDMIADGIDGADLPYFIVSGNVLTKDANDKYPLPDDHKTLLRVRDNADDTEIYPQRENSDFEVYRQENEFLILENWQTDLPAALKVRIRRFPPYLGDWDGTDDDADVVPLAPLNNARGSRLLARLIKIFAQSKDEDLTKDEADLAKGLIDTFLDRIGGSDDETIDQELGT